jgi:hypothetical protein
MNLNLCDTANTPKINRPLIVLIKDLTGGLNLALSVDPLVGVINLILFTTKQSFALMHLKDLGSGETCIQLLLIYNFPLMKH